MQVTGERAGGWRVIAGDRGFLWMSFDAPGVWLHPYAGGPPVRVSDHQTSWDSWTAVDPNGDLIWAETVRAEQDLGLIRLSRD